MVTVQNNAQTLLQRLLSQYIITKNNYHQCNLDSRFPNTQPLRALLLDHHMHSKHDITCLLSCLNCIASWMQLLGVEVQKAWHLLTD